ncbi:MAG: isoprenylcysteine carboxylmethyltransferase family protein [Proteobacteria bacterium]|nr:isoprenylcysteine carboxylmethyltransferase family protein [Pseudomonadota bacterium]MCP4920657.1 isoprenylcysteine carboxylmethyltransferase family protein [Pseudomonadota bacterium]
MSLGARLFRLRGLAPVPVLAAQLVLADPAWSLAPLALVAAGEGVRLWAVGHIGPASRTRGDDATQLVTAGPYSRLRNPLYVGNTLMWVGVGLASSWPWALGWLLLLALHYGLIVSWEEENLTRQLGAPYRAYTARTPRWLPLGRPVPGRWSWWTALSSERSTLVALAVVLIAVAI